MQVIIWEFEVPENQRPAFERAYGTGGDWVRLFAKGAGYEGTDLLSDHDNPARYVTIDRWQSAADRDRFMADLRESYRALDKRCEAFTTSEKWIGSFSPAESGG
ncbi:hypothetical protein SULPSESMR1_03796 (plasmid) [Pseudosulfitobacter pseudonitzschiae]|uniref:ABM domain-containing protein n=1 Tax=Pseudosulfitobacter pseudonitzschiae TaxID=1402135 RepID=A0A221K9B2_9RHOB|nr:MULTISPECIES: antibiotic biosynthesis monooxygenase [Roseobacteraceae]ASM75594.1 hypothetical protein SULPSESMR1_03796 [Pseudosulfitobacter pseudonitzschiae]